MADHGTFIKNGRVVDAANAEHAVRLQARGWKRHVPDQEDEVLAVAPEFVQERQDAEHEYAAGVSDSRPLDDVLHDTE